MAINFTKPMINQLQQEITELECKIKNEKNKLEKSKSKIIQLEKDMKISKSHSDLSNKMSRIKKLNDEIKTIPRMRADLSKQLATKRTLLKQLQANESNKETREQTKG